MNVVWAPAALRELKAIREFIQIDNPERGRTFVDEMFAAGARIADMPRAFPLVPKLESKHVRRRAYGRYVILYRVEAERVDILHVAHSAQDYIRNLFDIP